MVPILLRGKSHMISLDQIKYELVVAMSYLLFVAAIDRFI
jgi:hypothetical protein